jgi:NAD(P)-dependent dehydrogenase (short-subunit alcohol dehydrogenase family)
MNASFAGKKLLVVGGTSGMGFETAKLVLKNGGSVVLVAIARTKPRGSSGTGGRRSGFHHRCRPDERRRDAARGEYH